jgi:flagellar basal body rod protein FlgB
MDVTSLAPDNLTELLTKIVEFTASRRSVLYQNIREIRTDGFVPRDMPASEFAHVMNGAIAEHLLSKRLLFRDTENIKFGQNGEMRVSAVPDQHARSLLQNDPNEYLEHQVKRLLENALNRTVAEDLLKMKSEPPFASGPAHIGNVQIQDNRSGDSFSPSESDM